MKKFNNEQLTAIHHGDGPMMVIAGPGSGKTTVLVNRVLYLTRELGVPEEDILVITFTRAAAQEMEQRYLKEKAAAQDGKERHAGPGAKPVHRGTCRRDRKVSFGTFHSIFFSFLRERMGYRNEDVAEAGQCMELMWQVLCGPELRELRLTSDIAAVILSELGSRKNGMAHRDYPLPEDIMARISEAYESAMHKRRLLDFDDMLIRFYELLCRDRALLSMLRKRFRYIMIDEFQDINPVQYQIIRLLCEPLRNIFIVGDDDQSIYGFRGSDPGIMLHFPVDFPELRTVTLATNYRSGSNIVEASLRLIGNNRSRYRKALRACPEHTGRDKGYIRTEAFSDEKEEARALVREIRAELAGSGGSMDLAVLYRVHRAAAPLIAELKKEGLYGSVRLMTFHGAKGLEFDKVYIICANEGITPWKLASDERELEEERRTFYVAMTRARHELHIFYTKQLYSRKQKRTRYISELHSRGGKLGSWMRSRYWSWMTR